MVDRLRDVHGITPRNLFQYVVTFPLLVFMLSAIAQTLLIIDSIIKSLFF